jgi:hypothetical protein
VCNTEALPSEDEVRGDDPDGLALRFDCTTTATPDMAAASFQVGLIRIDHLQAITFATFEGSDDDGYRFEDEASPTATLRQNADVDRSARRVILRGDGDGFDYAEVRVTVPRKPGDVVTGKFYYECETDCEGSPLDFSVPITCATSELEAKE